MDTPQDVMTTEETAAYLRLQKNTLEVWRLKGCGPVFMKFGRRVLYRRDAVEKFMADQERRSTSDVPGRHGRK
jgi:excisionase family DNA binding protein